MARRKYRRRRKRTRWQNYSGAAKQLYRDVRMLKNAVNVEYHTHDFESTTTIPNTGSLVACNDIAQGDDHGERTGLTIKGQYFKVQGSIVANAGISGAVRLVVLNDKCNEIQQWSDVFDTSGSVLAPYADKIYSKRFKSKLLYDRTFFFNPGDSASALVKPVKFKIPTKFHTTFSGPNGVDTENNALIMILISDNPTAATINARLKCRYVYTDN